MSKAKWLKEMETEDCLRKEINDCVQHNAAKRGDKFWTYQTLDGGRWLTEPI